MSEISIIEDFEEFQSEIDRLHDEIEAARGRLSAEPWAAAVPPQRPRFEELDLSRFRQDMLSVHKTLQWRGHNWRLSFREAKKARLVAIAGMCELIKDEFVGKFWDLYKKTIGSGWGADTTVYNWIWGKGFAEAGIEVLGDERREFVQTLVMESGVPKNRTADIINFFVIYWRYLRGQDVFSVVQRLIDGYSFAHIPQQERRQLVSLASEASEFSHAFALAVSRLSVVFDFVCNSPDIFGGTINDWTEQIFKATRVNPLSVLRDRDQLRKLYSRILGIVTPEKLSRIMAAKPPGTEIHTPDGLKVRSDRYHKIQLGRHQIDGTLFICLPAPDLELPFLATRPLSQIFEHGDAVFVRSFAEITPVVNGSVRTDLVRKLYNQGLYCGNFFFCKMKAAMEITVRTGDGAVDSVLVGRDGFVCYPYLHYQGNPGKNEHYLSVRVNSIKLVATGRKNWGFRFCCSKEKEPLFEGETDPTGRAVCGERFVLLENPQPEEISFMAVERFSGKILDFSDSVARVALSLDVVMLFSPHSHNQIMPRQSKAPFLFGSRRFVLFVAMEMAVDKLRLQNCEVGSTAICGRYRVCDVIWKDQSDPCHILAAVSNTQTIGWSFEKCFDFKLYLNRKSGLPADHVRFRQDQGRRLSDFELVLFPFPEPEVQRQLFLNVIVNDSTPLRILLTDCCSEFTEEKSLRISGDDLAKKLSPLWGSQPVNAVVEISLCALDETLADRKIFLFPDLNVVLPKGVRDGEEFMVQVDLGDSGKGRWLSLKNARGRSKVRVTVEYENGEWRLRRSPFRGTVNVESLETFLDIEALPPCQAVRFGARDKGKAEPPREILKRELASYDLLVAAARHSSPHVSVNGKKVQADFRSDSEGLWCLPLTELPGIVEQENKVTISVPGMNETFIIKYRLALLQIEVEKYLISGEMCGTCSFCGPVGSRMELHLRSIFHDGGSANVCAMQLQPDGLVIYGHSFAIPVSECDGQENFSHYDLRAVLFEKEGQAGHEYGERWEILPESAVGQDDFQYLKKKIKDLLNDGKVFAAIRHLQTAGQVAPPSEWDWLETTTERTRKKQICISLDRVASQIASVLRRDFQFDIKM